MTKQEEKNFIIIAILINVGIFSCVGLCIAGAITSIFWLVYLGFAFLGVIGILCPIVQGIIAYKSAKEDEKRIAKKQLTDAKQMMLNMDKKEWITFILLTTIILTLFILTIVFGILSDFDSKYLVPMFICIGLFVGVGLVGGLITAIKQRNTDKKILKSPNSKSIKVVVISKDLYSSLNGKEKYRYSFLIGGKKVYGVSVKKLEQGDEIVVLYDERIPKYCVII